MNDEEILEAFRRRVLEEWLPAYCADPKRARLVHPAYAAEIYDLAFQRLGQSGAALAQWAAARECGGLGEDEDA